MLVQQAIAAGDLMAAQLRSGSQSTKAELIARIVAGVTLREDRVDIALDPQSVREALGLADESAGLAATLDLTCPSAQVGRGHRLRLVIPAPAAVPAATREEKLVSLIADARSAAQLLRAAPNQSIAAIANATGRCRTRLARLIALSCLAPDIVTAIVEGRQPPSLTAKSLFECELPLAWTEQRVQLGFS